MRTGMVWRGQKGGKFHFSKQRQLYRASFQMTPNAAGKMLSANLRQIPTLN